MGAAHDYQALVKAAPYEIGKAAKRLWIDEIQKPHDIYHDFDKRQAANVENTFNRLELYRLSLLKTDADDSDIRKWAENSASWARFVVESSGGEIGTAYQALCIAVRGSGLKPIASKEELKQYGYAGAIARMTCPRWHRRQARIRYARQIDRAARELGQVYKGRACYVGDTAYTLNKQRAQHTAETLAEMVAINEQGEQIELAELADKGTGNPYNRFAELMVKVKGFEAIADEEGHGGLFITVTAPSNYHAASAKGGRVNPKFDPSTSPRKAQAWMQSAWTKARAAFGRLYCNVYGLRVAEPHHDGCPHWHLCLFASDTASVEAIIKRYWSVDAEAGAATNRVKIKALDSSKGSAAGYCVKYLSKALTGARINSTKTTGENGELFELDATPEEGVARIKAWASTWGIRQFQTIGGAPVGIWRELRRIKSPLENEGLEKIRLAADGSDYAEYIRLMGGIEAKSADRPVKIWREEVSGVGMYGDDKKPVIRGVEYQGQKTATREHEWEVAPKKLKDQNPNVIDAAGRFAARKAPNGAPWTCVNKCTRDNREGVNPDGQNRIADGASRAPFAEIGQKPTAKSERRGGGGG